MIEINKLIPTQNDIRNYDSVSQMLCKLEAGETLPPIIIKELDDGKIYIHDGLHRACALWLHGVSVLPESGYILKHFTYHQFLSVNFQVGWVTPFDLRTECRKADLYNWKQSVTEYREALGSRAAESYIKWYCNKYKEPREVWCIEDVIKRNKNADILEYIKQHTH